MGIGKLLLMMMNRLLLLKNITGYVSVTAGVELASLYEEMH